jgi:hypothetical protein
MVGVIAGERKRRGGMGERGEERVEGTCHHIITVNCFETYARRVL